MGNDISKAILVSFFGLYYGTFAILVLYTACDEGWCLCGHLKQALSQCFRETNPSSIVSCIQFPFSLCIKCCIRRRRNVVGYDPVEQSIV